MTPMATRTVVLVASLALSPTFLAGCGGDDSANGPSSGQGTDVDYDPGSGELTVNSSEGTYTVGDNLPEGYPVDDVPVLEGRIVSAVAGADAGNGTTGFVVMMTVESDGDTAIAEAVDLLTEAGFTAVDGSPTEGTGLTGARQLTKEPYTVGITVFPADANNSTVQYVVEVA